MAPENYRAWKLYNLCRNQVRQYKIIRGKEEYIVTDLAHEAILATLELENIFDKDERKQLFEDIRFIYEIKQEVKK